jgi:hypothetical protein
MKEYDCQAVAAPLYRGALSGLVGDKATLQ